MSLWMLAIFPAVAAMICLPIRSRAAVLNWVIAGSAAELALAIVAARDVFRLGEVTALAGHMSLDALSAFHLTLMTGVGFLTSLYARDYFSHESHDEMDDRNAWKFGGLWFSFIGSMVGVLIFNNVGLMWVAMESTTLATTFLVCLHPNRASVEAAWKYLILCSAGIILGLLGTIFIYGAAVNAGLEGEGALKWSSLVSRASAMDPRAAQIGFILILVGYGTKVGLAPMHSWLPDAHSQAPTPVSAMFSGVLLNCGFYCITRFMPIVSGAVGDPTWCRNMLLGFGLLSMAIAAIFILGQKDLKRLLAYSSIEHMGVISVGMGLGLNGCFAALYHTLNHSVCKPLAFFCAGRTIQEYGTREIDKLSGSVSRVAVWGPGLMVAILTLIGCAPFSIFMSEFLIVRAGVEGGHWIAVALFLASVAAVFAGALKPAMSMAFSDDPAESHARLRPPLTAYVIVVSMSAALIGFGLWLPEHLRQILNRAASIIVTGG